MTPIPDSALRKAVIFAPLGRDAAVAETLLKEIDVPSATCGSLAEFAGALNDVALFAVVTEEVLQSADLTGVVAAVRNQPSWSDLPFLILTHRGAAPERNPDAVRLSELLGNVTYLERPFRPATFASVARTALKSRERQFELRSRIEQLHEGEERLRTALIAGRLGSFEISLDDKTLIASDTCKHLFGRAADQPFTYEDLVATIHAEDMPRVAADVERTVETGNDLAAEGRIVWPDGSIHWLEIRARLVRNRLGSRPRLVGVALDNTQRKTSEEMLQRVNESLEERVAARTAELRDAHAAMLAQMEQREKAEQQLLQVQKMEMIGQLTGGVAHDFNNLLMAIMGNLDLLRKYLPADARSARLLDGALQGAERGAALTQRLLAFARRQELKTEPRDIAVLIRGMTDLIERSVGTGVDLRFDFPAKLPAALVDANQLELAILNLVVNARDAMPDGGALTIQLARAQTAGSNDLPAGDYIRLTVRDTGKGMDAETLRRATEPFFSTKGVGKGTGLGLSMIQGLALQLKGALRLTSEVGKGTAAELWLPLAHAPAAAVEPTEGAKGANGHAETKLKILVVDDDALIAMSTTGMLEDLGHEVIEANSGERALQILNGGDAVDLIITDYAMPKMNGMQLADAIRALRPGLPILLATGYADIPEGKTLNLPRIGKPYRQDQLAAEIEKLSKRGAV
ncbi:MAG: ATP-binding protein [Alphaproteobacteria bacterium]